MRKKQGTFFINIILIIISIIYTILVKIIDVKEIGIENTKIGFSHINYLIYKQIGVNMTWYHFTDWLLIIPILVAFYYTIIGIIQLIKRKNILKVNKEIIILGIFYLVVICLYIFFEKNIINYRPILINGIKEASYPSSHTLITICICGSTIIMNKLYSYNKKTKYINKILLLIILITIIGRLLSGVHWFTDILGGIIISTSLLMILYSCLSYINKP